MADRPPLRDAADLAGADADTIRAQLHWELLRLMSELRLKQLRVATDIGYKSSAGAFSRWASGETVPPPSKAKALDETYPNYKVSLPGETFSSLRDLYDRRKRAFAPPPTHYDAFIASPMAAAAEGAYAEERSAAMELADALERFCDFRNVYYAGKRIENAEAFESPNIAITANTHALSHSRYFILLVLDPPATPSGVYVEAGIALGLKLPSLYFVPHTGREYLPWMLETIGAVSASDLPPVSIEQVKSIREATQRLRTHGRQLFHNLDSRKR
jgi:hypothetical protein